MLTNDRGRTFATLICDAVWQRYRPCRAAYISQMVAQRSRWVPSSHTMRRELSLLAREQQIKRVSQGLYAPPWWVPLPLYLWMLDHMANAPKETGGLWCGSSLLAGYEAEGVNAAGESPGVRGFNQLVHEALKNRHVESTSAVSYTKQPLVKLTQEGFLYAGSHITAQESFYDTKRVEALAQRFLA